MSGGRQLLRPMLRLLLGAVLMSLPVALAGCALGQQPHPDVASRPQIVYVDRAVPVACADAKSLPQVPAPVGARLSGEARHDAAILAEALLDERGARDSAMALLTACVK